MNKNRSPIIQKWAPVKHIVILTTLAPVLLACQSQGNSSAYPDLRTVSSPTNKSFPLEERRQIVRDLMDYRDVARHRKAVVRHRSGLSDVPPPEAPVSTKTRAEDIIRSAPIEDPGAVGEGEGDQSESIFRDPTQFDDGTLDDFIRRLKRDTTPTVGETPTDNSEQTIGEAEELTGEDVEPKPQSWRFQGEPAANYAAVKPGLDRPIILAAFAPAVMQHDAPVAILLATNHDDQGFLCTYLGWAVAWSNTCLDEEASAGSKDEEVAGLDVEEAPDQEPSTQSEDLPADDEDPVSGSDDVADQNQSGADDETTASEDIGDDDALLPVTSTLDRLRNLIRSRTSRSEGTSTDRNRKSLSYEADELKPSKEEGPPLPSSRPDVEEDLRIVRNDHLFEFERTPRPAFKPLPPEPETVIFAPEKPKSEKDVDFRPAARPSKPVVEQHVVDDDPKTAQPESQQELAARRDLDQAKTGPTGPSDDLALAPTIVPEDPDDSLLIDSELILFDFGSAKLPAAFEDDARQRQG